MVARLCQDRKINVNELFDLGSGHSKAALHAAATGGDLKVHQELVSHGANGHADVNLGYLSGFTLLYQAVLLEKLEIAEFLQKHGAIVDPVLATRCLAHALARPKTEIVEFLVSHGAEINGQDMHPLHIATRSKQLDNVKFLMIKKGLNVHAQDESGYTPAQIAATVGWLEGLKFFMKETGIKPNPDWKDAAFEIFMHSEDPEEAATIKYLIDNELIHIDSRDSDGATLLYRAWELGRMKTVEVLLPRTANPVARSRAGETRWDIAMMAEKPWNVSKYRNLPSVHSQGQDRKCSPRLDFRHVKPGT